MSKRRLFEDVFKRHSGYPAFKWKHYFEIYDGHIGKWQDLPVKILEIGVQRGGSLQIWREYLGLKAQVFGIDIDPRCKAREGERIEIFIGDQSDPDFLQSVGEAIGPVDIILDDGSHHMKDLTVSFLSLFKLVKPGGIYIAEDLHTCYWDGYGGGLRNPDSFIEKLKTVIDDMHALHSKDLHTFRPSAFTHAVKAMHFYDSVAVIDKTQRIDLGAGRVDWPEEIRAGRKQNDKYF